MRSRLILITMAALTAMAPTAVAGSLGVWVVNPVSGDIIRVDPTTGGVLGAFPCPVQLQQDDRDLGLTMAFGGNTLLYQLGPLSFSDERRMLYALDPFTGLVQTSGEVLSFSGPSGLSSVTKGNRTFVYWVHTSS